MKKLYADYADGTHLERWIPDDFRIWPDGHVHAGGATHPIGWITDDGYEAWLDSEGLRFLAIMNPDSPAAADQPLTETELRNLLANAAEDKPTEQKQPAVLGDHRGQPT